MAEKTPFSWSSQTPNRDTEKSNPSGDTEKSKEKSATPAPMSDRGVLSPRAAPDTYYERVAAAMGKTAGEAPKKMTSDNYQEIYRQQQAIQNAVKQGLDASLAEAERKKAAESKQQADLATREKHLSSQIDAWRKTLGQDADADLRTRATIETLSRELANLRKK